jgi:fibronectin-binding autotransporter adhesin
MFITKKRSTASMMMAVAVAGSAGWIQPTRAGEVIVNFGDNFTGTDAMGRHYTSISSIGNGPFALNDITSASTGYQLDITNPAGTAFNDGPNGTSTPTAYTAGFNTFNGNGTTAPTGEAATLGYAGAVTAESAYGNTAPWNNGSTSNVVPQVLLTLTGLNPAQTYGFDLFASRTGVTDNRTTDYTITGGSGGTSSTTLSLNVANNTGNVVSASGFSPNSSGDISILVDADAANTNSNKFFYLSVLQINSSGPNSSFLTYTGSVNGNFDTSTANFTTGGSATAFATNDNVIFDDSATGTHSVTVVSGGVNPASVTFNNSSSTYTLTGGAITGSGKLTVSGTGAVLLNNPNSYTGGTTVNAGGNLQVGSFGAIGSGSLSVAGTLSLNGGNVSVSTLSSSSGIFSYQVGSNSLNTLTASSATLSGTTMISLANVTGSALTPGTTYPLMTAAGGISGSVIFNGRENLTVPGNVAIQDIGGTAYRLTLGETGSQVTVTAALAPSHTISIMPLGSSSTEGDSAQNPYNGGGYRSQLYQSLVDDGRYNPQFVGSSTVTGANNPTAPDLMTVVGQTHHEGHGGYTTVDVMGNLNANAGTSGNDGGYWLKPGNGINPDYITLNIGSNDYAYNAQVTGVINNLENILNQIFTLRPNATVVLSNIFYRGDNPAGSLAAQTNYNALMPALVYQDVLAGDHISFFDLYSTLTPNNSLALIGPDLIHPTQAGYDVEANGWFNAVTKNQAFYTGAQGSTWNATGTGGSTSWDMDYQRTTDAMVVPSAGTDVYFNGVGGNTTLGANTSVRSVNFTAGATTPVTIGGNNTLTLGTGGITVQAGTAAHTISAPVVLGIAQSWSNVSSSLFTVSGNVSGGGSLTIGGSGVIAMTGTSNTYSGGTSVSGGTLVVAGGGTGTGSVTIASGATLMGSGSTASTVNVSGTITGGNLNSAIATFSTGAQTWNGAGHYRATVGTNGSSNDLITMPSLQVAASSSGPFHIDVIDASPFTLAASQSLVLATDSDLSTSDPFFPTTFLATTQADLSLAVTNISPASGFSFALVGVPDLSAQQVVEGYSLELTELPAAVPEPSALCGTALAGLALCARRRRVPTAR